VNLPGKYKRFTAALAWMLAAPLIAFTQTSLSDRVLVVYNSNAPDSRPVARYYMKARGISERNTCKISASSDVDLSPDQFEAEVKVPVRKCLDAAGRDRILYIVFAYGSPYLLRWNGQNYALDAFVADIWDEFLPFRPATQNEVQPYFGFAQSEGGIYQAFVPLSADREKAGAKRIYSVWRLDGAKPALAKGLVDKALYAESHGLTGKGCFDLNADITGLADYRYGAGNWDIHEAAEFARKAGFPVEEDTHEQEFGTAPAPLRCDGAALYAGWYSLNHYNDAFSWNPGAIGIHLDSASAMDPRGGANWAANALIKGITITSGAVGEPYLDNLPHPDQVFLYLFEGANAGDALLRSTRMLKWMIINIGDPLYRPFPNGIHLEGHAPEIVLGLLPQISVAGTMSAGLIGFNRQAPAGGVSFTLKAAPGSAVKLPETVAIPAGANHIVFPITAGNVREDATTVQISATHGDMARSNTLILFPTLAPLALPPTVRGGAVATGTVVLRKGAPAAGIVVTLATSDAAVASVPNEVRVEPGKNAAAFSIQTQHAIAQRAVTITASYDGVTRQAALTVLP
jgi:uncharacterized protein (TIGR03790 family)